MFSDCGTTNHVTVHHIGPAVPQPRPLVLASVSPRRGALLRDAGYEFEVVAPPVHEPPSDHPHAVPEALAGALAYFKARSVVTRRPNATILGADTLVALGDRTIGKPRDAADARRILGLLSGSVHRVVSGLALLAPGGSPRLIRCAVTELRMRAMSSQELDDYIASGEWQDKAGAYAIQESGDRFVEIISGSPSNVVGLPLELLASMCTQWIAVAPAEAGC